MNQDERELEVKFLLANMPALERKLQALGASLVTKRTFESNLRFDWPNGSLSKAGQALRLRHDENNILTFKGAASDQQGVLSRQEIEFKVSNYESARHFLEALGFQVTVAYEKRRTTYAFEGVEIMLDEMPFGNFCEVEGADPALIQAVAIKLGLNWDARTLTSYLMIFAQVRGKLHLNIRDLTFVNFRGITVENGDLGMAYADLS
jgi:adenylate cyclase, class 2